MKAYLKPSRAHPRVAHDYEVAHGYLLLPQFENIRRFLWNFAGRHTLRPVDPPVVQC
jgi:hypothetical protein